jgi:hypothetical protein
MNNYTTNSLEMSFSLEANSYSATPVTSSILGNPNVHYHVHKKPQVVPIQSQMNPAHSVESCFLQIHLIVSCHLRPGLPMVSFFEAFLRLSNYQLFKFDPKSVLPKRFSTATQFLERQSTATHIALLDKKKVLKRKNIYLLFNIILQKKSIYFS